MLAVSLAFFVSAFHHDNVPQVAAGPRTARDMGIGLAPRCGLEAGPAEPSPESVELQPT